MKQSFNIDNFIKIFYNENRKGNYVEGSFSIFEPLQDFSKSIKKINNNFKIKKYTTIDKKEQANKSKDILKKRKFEKLKHLLETIESKINNRDYSLGLTTFTIKTKPVYTVDKSNPEVFFLLKQLQMNIQHSFKVKQSDRYEIVSQVINMLDNNFPKYVIRTDIKSFFESIPHDKLQKKISQNYILSPESKKIINGILRQYKSITGSDSGIPRGVGISSYLSELYLRDFDNEIKKLSNLTYYARYVDDIILIFTPHTKYDNTNYLDNIRTIISNFGLELNPKKTESFDLVNLSIKQIYHFDFLGFNMQFDNNKEKDNKILINLSNKKKRLYSKKIKLMIDDYNINSKYDEKQARKLLINRIRYLTGNIRLLGVKKDILVGIYFSNILLNEKKHLDYLDRYFIAKINKDLVPYPSLTHINVTKFKSKLQRYSFIDGFENKKFYKFSKIELQNILSIWNQL